MARTPYRVTKAAPNQFTTILQQGMERGMLPVYTQESRDWYRKQAQRVTTVNESALVKSEPDRYRGVVVPGRLYMFYYDPKLKQKLPYYDTLPLVFPIDVGSGYMLGLNMHYLPHELRAKLMDALYPYMTNLDLDQTTRLQVTYKLLKSVAKLAPFRPCIKKYLRSHIRSRFVLIDVKEWDIALFLPLERFEKASARHVWAQSREQMNVFGKTKRGR